MAIAADAVVSKVLQKAAKEEKKISVEEGQLEGLTVLGDGSWESVGSLLFMVSQV